MLHAVKLTTKISAYLSPKIACLSLTCWQWYSVMFACHASCAVLGVDWLWDWGRRRGEGEFKVTLLQKYAEEGRVLPLYTASICTCKNTQYVYYKGNLCVGEGWGGCPTMGKFGWYPWRNTFQFALLCQLRMVHWQWHGAPRDTVCGEHQILSLLSINRPLHWAQTVHFWLSIVNSLKMFFTFVTSIVNVYSTSREQREIVLVCANVRDA